jgi:hypothetical protein
MYFFCEYCKSNCNSKQYFDKHILTEKHKNNILKNNLASVFTCAICNKAYKTKGYYTNHIAKCKRKISSGLVSSCVPINAVSKVLATIDNNLSLTPHGSQQVGNNNTIANQITNKITNKTKNIHNFTKLYTTLQNYTKPYSFPKKGYTLAQSSTNLYNTLHKIVHKFT